MDDTVNSRVLDIINNNVYENDELMDKLAEEKVWQG